MIHHVLPKELEKQFHNVLIEKEKRSRETKEEKLERVSKKLNIQKHGKGKRKKKTKKKGGR